ncbi:MAG: hypothetical protein V1668_00340 [Patescibacteria group bacterium]
MIAYPIKHRELLFVVIWCCFCIGIVLLPYFLGVLATPSGKQFTYITTASYQDTNSYFTWVRQAQEGHFFFQDQYTSEFSARYLFHPIFLLVGLVVKLTLIPVIFIWLLLIIVADFFLLFSIYKFLSYFIKSSIQRALTFIFVSLGSGFGWFIGWRSIDLRLTETTIFQSLSWPFIFSIAISLLLWFFIFALRSLTDENLYDYKLAKYAGFVGFLLALIHPYDLITAYIVLGLYVIIFKLFRKQLKKLLFIFLPPILPLIYDLIIQLIDPVLRRHNQTLMPTDNILYIISGFGLILFFAILGANIIFKKRERSYYFILLWAISSLIIIYIPFSFQRRLIMGAIIPIVMLASYFFLDLFNRLEIQELVRWKASWIKRMYFFTIIIIILFLSSISNLIIYSHNLKAIATGGFPYYLETDLIIGMRWFNVQGYAGQIVLSSEMMGSFIPRFSSIKVYLGHWAQTIDELKKFTEVKQFFSTTTKDSDRVQFLIKNKIDYIYYSRYEGNQINNNCLSGLANEKIINRVYTNSSVVIYKVNYENI